MQSRQIWQPLGGRAGYAQNGSHLDSTLLNLPLYLFDTFSTQATKENWDLSLEMTKLLFACSRASAMTSN
eukprot:1730330-Pleurochrysis_carterae.AAC.1